MNTKSESFVISIMSRDRVGIVYEISSAIRDLGGNIADIRQSVMCGYFTMILLATFPPDVTQRTIERKIAEVDARSDTPIGAMVTMVDNATLKETTRQPSPENAYVLTATGTDQIGFVATVSSFCVKHDINILDLSTTTIDGTYIMILEIDLQCCNSIQAVRQDLVDFSKETGIKVVLQHYDIFRATNEITLPVH